ncbi:DNA topology modulation protein FlaR [Pontibacillus sp. ALD_SL1]|uniref:DNA topology modulation protein FlaR n=1 Tax=Pontibacillus sp. ALD_SL1 TaxID=2777185 RepID=UPI001F61266D|nr:DNA topology modulation protein FlaR [Pontibacillus sp. ALD_SL1]
MECYRKIHIFGSVASGKTTVAKKLSHTLEIPYYELDNIVWDREPPEDVRRSEEERGGIVQEIIVSDTWIMEGVHLGSWMTDSFREADVILFLDLPYYLRRNRILSRFLKQKLKLEEVHYKPTLRILRNMLNWNKTFESSWRFKFLYESGVDLDKVVCIRNRRDLNKLIHNLRDFKRIRS